MPHQCTDCGRGFEDGSKEMLSGCPNCGGTTFQFQPEGVESGMGDESAEPPEPPDSGVDSTVARTVGSAATAVRDIVGSSSSDNDDTRGSRPQQSKTTDSSAEEPSISTGTTDEPVASSNGETEQSTSSGGDPKRPASAKQEPDWPSSNGESSSPSTTTPDAYPQPGDSQNETADTAGISADTLSHEDGAQASARSEIVGADDLPPAPDSSADGTIESPADDTAEPTVEDQNESTDEDQPDLDELREQLNKQFESIRVLAPGQYELNIMELYDREEYIVALQEDGKYTIQVPERWGE